MRPVVSGLALLLCVSSFAQDPALSESFDQIADGQLPPGWQAVSGAPRVEGGRLVVDAIGKPVPMVCFGDPAWQDYRVEVDLEIAQAAESTRWAALMWRVADDPLQDGYYLYTVRQGARAGNGLEFTRKPPKATGLAWSVYQTARAGADMRPGEVHRLALEVRGGFVEQWFDGEFVLRSPFAVALKRGRLGFTCSGTRAYFDNLKVIALTPSEQQSLPTYGGAVVVAHRGYSAIAPENTLAAFRAAIEAKAPAAECDVYCTADGHVVLLHDNTVDRTTDGTGPITGMTLEQVKQLDAGSWKGEQYKGEPIPTLAETLELVKGKMQLVVEVKQAGIAHQVVETIRQAEMLEDVTIISFNAGTCREIRKLEPRLPVGWLAGGSGVDDARARALMASTLGADAQMIDIISGAVSPELMRRANLAGVTVWVWTVDDPDMVKLLAQIGVRAITTNDPAMALKALAE